MPYPKTIAIPIDAIKYIIGDIQPARLYNDILILKDSQVFSLKYSFCLSCSPYAAITLLPEYVSLILVVIFPPITIFLFEASFIRFLINATGKNAIHKTRTPTKASFQEL